MKEAARVQRVKKEIKVRRAQKDQQEELGKLDRMGPLELLDLLALPVGLEERDRLVQQEEMDPEVLVASLVNQESQEMLEHLENLEETARGAIVVKKVQRALVVLRAHLESQVNVAWLAYQV